MRIGKNIRYFRSQKGVSQQWLADAIGVSKMSISYFERDKRRPDIETVKRICSALNVSLGKFMAFSDSITLSDGSFQKSDELSAAQKKLHPRADSLFSAAILRCVCLCKCGLQRVRIAER